MLWRGFICLREVHVSVVHMEAAEWKVVKIWAPFLQQEISLKFGGRCSVE